jgi:ribosome-binding protein aMBF1 (putative translation factor)
LSKIRENRSYSQDQLTAKLKVNRSTISKIENEKFSFSTNYLSKFSWFLDFDFNLVDNERIEKK